KVTKTKAVSFLLDRNVLHAAIHLIGGGEDDHRLPPSQTGSFQDIEGAERVYLEIRARIRNGCRYRYLPGQVINLIGVFDDALYGSEIPDIAFDDTKLRSFVPGG